VASPAGEQPARGRRDVGVGLIAMVRSTFRAWVDLLTEQLIAVGVPPVRAIALTTVAGMEGALILCRAEGNVEPLEVVAAELMKLPSVARD
jgi:TetR/AcrR family transcriptional regulator, lmrAB and yxaGH operons repressor